MADAFFKRIHVPKRVLYAVLFDLPYNCVGIAKNPLPKGWSQKISTSFSVIDTEYMVLSKEVEYINEWPGAHIDEKFEDFSE